MTLSESRDYFKSFTCEVLTASEQNKFDIQSFSSKIRNNHLEKYLKESAWEDDTNGVTRVYLIRDSDNKVVMFFSLKCGAVFTTYELDDKYRSLSSAEKDFVQKLIDAQNINDMDSFYQYVELGKELFLENHDTLVRIAQHRYSTKNESHEIGDTHDVLKVASCYAAIELQHFCKQDNYHVSPNISFPLGFGLFWEQIVPIVEEIANKVGCEYLYLFAADRSENSDEKKLVLYYKEALSFINLNDEGVILLKPGYDDDCIGLLQKVKYLSKMREISWESFSDHVDI